MEMVSKGLIDPHAIAACTEKVDVWALGITLYELLTGAFARLAPDLVCVMRPPSISSHRQKWGRRRRQSCRLLLAHPYYQGF